MNKIMELVKSRKAWQAIIAFVLGIWGFYEGQINAGELLALYAVVGGLWANAQAKVDAAKVALNQ